MALINFDCPECGHNLEVDEGGAGFIVKCPECGNPLQIPDLPPSPRRQKILLSAAAVLAVLLLIAGNLFLWAKAAALKQDVDELRPLGDALQNAQAISMQQEAEIARLQHELAQRNQPASEALADAALTAIEEAESLAGELDDVSLKLVERNTPERLALLRAHMRQLVEAAKNSLPAAPVITEAASGRGIQGRQILFPVLPGPDGQMLRENAEVTGVEEDKVAVKFAGGTATYALTELHPGVAAYLPVDPLMALPRNQWQREVIRLHQVQGAARDQRLMELREAIEAQLPPDSLPSQ